MGGSELRPRLLTGRRRALVLLITLSLASCGVVRQSPVAEGSMPGDYLNFPPPSALARSTAYTDADRLRLGPEFNPLLPNHNVAPAWSGLGFVPDFDPAGDPPVLDAAYGFFSFSLAGYEDEPAVSWYWTPVPYGELLAWQDTWIALSDWELDTWQWFQGNPAMRLELDSLAPHISPGGDLLAGIVLLGTETGLLDHVRVGPKTQLWEIETVDSEVQVTGIDLELVLDAWPCIAYLDTLQHDIKFASRVVEGWEVEIAFDRDTTSGDICCLADNPERIYIFYVDVGSSELRGLGYSMASWGHEVVPIDRIVGPDFSTVMADSHQLCVAYHNSDTDALDYAYYNGLIMVPQTVDDSGDVGYSISLAMTSDGSPRIAYYSMATDDLKYAWFHDAMWEYVTVDEEFLTGMPCSLALDLADLPMISYYDRTAGNLQLASNDGADWDIQIIDDNVSTAVNYNDIAADSAGQPHIAYCDAGTNELRYACLDGGEWQVTVIDSDPHGCGTYCSIALDEIDRVRIAYAGYDDPHSFVLKYAHQLD